ncbi:HAMP domain-containing sensor histidine kinase [Geobacter argillaceus]|uniref:histidine kinase n=1 Tax=Geobacter argillaceus TaxID=345631 RepID=A0A562WSG3_9BACT|nr:HAMP domain-containing sensor histidine kinase [Geobacter argillaceus]TWJ33110.1 two-component system NtrC family sensor kinase [Geobacter argillaceus]
MHRSLTTKLTIVTSVVLLITMTLFAYLNIHGVRKLLLDDAVNNAELLSETLINVTHYQMLVNDRKQVDRIMQDAGSQKGIECIRLINKEGQIIFSTNPKEAGTVLDKKAAACTMCHASGEPLLHASTMNRSRIFTLAGGKQVMGLAKAIYNETSCYVADCHFHPESAKVLGVLDVIVSLENMQAQLSSSRSWVIGLTMVLLLLISLFLAIFTQQLVNKPVKHLLDHTNLLAQGDLTQTIPFSSDDELGELAESFNSMTTSLKKARQELQGWNRTLELKVEERTREIQSMQAQLVRSEKLASVGELVAGIAHEINNPLTGILVYSNLVSEDAKLDPSLQDDMAVIVRETERCANIVRGLLKFSRESVPHKTRTSLTQVMDAALSLVEHQTLFQDIIIIRNYQKALPLIYLDPGQIEQVFINMVLNAGQAMDGTGSLTITIDITPDEQSLFVRVIDTGCGIAEETLAKIFDPFFTTKENRGTGLGLSVSYGIIKNHGGNIEVTSRVGEGTTFTIVLPIAPDEGCTKPFPDQDADGVMGHDHQQV